MQNSSSMSRVGILMGSDSDLSVMEKAVNVLKEMNVSHEVNVLSAHRMPDATAEYAKTARERGLVVIICGAGMAAHLAGVVASHTTLPVIGVPIKSGALKGVDALHSTVQMPPGIPVATMAIDGAANAAFLACEIIAVTDSEMAERLENKRKQTRVRLKEKASKVKKRLQDQAGED